MMGIRDDEGTVVQVPVGPVSPGLLTWLSARLSEVLQQNVTIGESILLPNDGYDPRRRQYLSEAILNTLQTAPYPAAGRVLGLTEADCYTPGLNFIFGQATLKGREAFVALPRLHASFYGLEEDLDLFRRRALKECVHELGHTWGLHHCRDPRCVMHFSNSLLDTDAKGMAFCPHCCRRLQRAGHLGGNSEW